MIPPIADEQHVRGTLVEMGMFLLKEANRIDMAHAEIMFTAMGGYIRAVRLNDQAMWERSFAALDEFSKQTTGLSVDEIQQMSEQEIKDSIVKRFRR